jgi:hypothetical protein
MTFNDLVHPSTMQRADAERALERRRKLIGRGASGLFLLRASSKSRGGVVISMYAWEKMHHFNFEAGEDGMFTNNKGRVMGSLQNMLRHYQAHNDGLPVVLAQFIPPP